MTPQSYHSASPRPILTYSFRAYTQKGLVSHLISARTEFQAKVRFRVWCREMGYGTPRVISWTSFIL